MNSGKANPYRSLLIGAVVVSVLSLVAVEPPSSTNRRLAGGEQLGGGGGGDTTDGGSGVDGGGSADGAAGGNGVTGPATGGQAGSKTGGGQSTKNLACRAGSNGGRTDVGVTGSKIKLAATNVRSGTGASFLGTSYIGMQAVVNSVNASGGVCGRLLELTIVDDGWDAARGAGYLKTFAKGDYFALPVVPSSEGLTTAITNGTIRDAEIPVIGTDGMLKEQYFDPWVWPVATSTVSMMRIMAKHAKDRGATSFGIVYDKRYKFGREGAAAFKSYVRKLTGRDPVAYIGIEPNRPNYSGDANRFNEACGEGCDFVAMLLDPITANAYIASQSTENGKKRGFGRVLTGGAQPLFNEKFAGGCDKACDGMLVWTGYNPPIGRLGSTPDVARYVNDVRSVDPGVDVNNQFLEGAYLGMRVFVEALKKAGPNLTREAVRDAMTQMNFQSTLAKALDWGASQRFANQCAQAFRIVSAGGSFAGFAEAGTGFLCDPEPGVVPSGD